MDLLRIVKKVISTAKKLDDFALEPAHAQPRSASRPQSGVDAYAFRGPVDQYFSMIFCNYFPEYTVQRNVRMNLASEAHVPVTFLLSRNGQHKLAIILCHSQEYNKLAIRNTMAACQALGIPVQRYFTDFRNDCNYVRSRMGQALR